MPTGKSTEGHIEIDGFTMGYKIEGSGPIALVLGSAVYYPRTFSQDLRNHLTLVFIDHRGFSRANRAFDHTAFHLDVLLSDFEKIRQHLGLDKVIAIGHSGHGYMALEYAKRYSHHVSHVVMTATSPDSSDKSFRAADQYLAESVCPERKAWLDENMQHLKSDIEACPQKRFIWYCLRSGAKIWYDYTFDASALWKDVEVVPEVFDYVWGKIFRELELPKA